MALIRRSRDLFPTLFSDLFDTENILNRDIFNEAYASIPAVNVTEKNNAYAIEVAIPGMKKDDLKINIDNDILTIVGEKQEEEKEETENFTRREFAYDSFSRSFRLPGTVATDHIEAKYEDGILKLNLPKKAEAIKKAAKEISIKK